MYICVWVCLQVHNAKVNALNGSERETQVGSGSGVVVVLQRGSILLPFPVSFPFLAVRKWRCMETATLSTRCFVLKVCKP